MRFSRALAFSTVSLSLICGGGGAIAQMRPALANGYDPPGVSTTWDAFASRQRVSNDVSRLRLARKAAKLINEGHCPAALQLAQSADDPEMATRITQVCAPAKVQAAATRTTIPAKPAVTPQ